MADVLLDACCLINICSSGRLPEILRAVPHTWHICSAVAGETLFVEVVVSGRRERSQVDLQPWFAAGLVHPCEPERLDEVAALVNYAARLDDGEAMCLALAKCRSWTVATDERKGRRIARGDSIPTLNTVEIVRAWTEQVSATPTVIHEVVNNIAVLGRYRPAVDAPSAEWWRVNGGSLST
jgi:predicted nucleic acid-binding protein